MCGFSPVEFDATVELARERVERPMDPRLYPSVEMNQLRRPRRRECSAVEMIFLTLNLLRGGTEGTLPIRTVAFNAGVSPATVSNYFSPCILSLHDTFTLSCPIVWASTSERRGTEVHVNGFPSGIVFVDGTKVHARLVFMPDAEAYHGRFELSGWAYGVYLVPAVRHVWRCACHRGDTGASDVLRHEISAPEHVLEEKVRLAAVDVLSGMRSCITCRFDSICLDFQLHSCMSSLLELLPSAVW